MKKTSNAIVLVVKKPSSAVASWFGHGRWIAAVIGLGGGVLIGLLVFGEIWHLKPEWGDLPTWLIFGVGLVGGVIGLVQFRAFVNDQDAVAERNKKRDQLMDSQLEETKRRRDADLRMQAEDIDLRWIQNSAREIAIVTNMSRRPITGITCRVMKIDRTLRKVPDECGLLPSVEDVESENRYVMVDVEPVEKLALLRRTLSCGFKFTDLPMEPAHQILVAWFKDDAGIPWQLDGYGHLVQANDGDEIVYKQ